MTRETKIGLLVGLAIILLLGIIISEHLGKQGELNPAGQSARTLTSFDPSENAHAGDAVDMHNQTGVQHGLPTTDRRDHAANRRVPGPERMDNQGDETRRITQLARPGNPAGQRNAADEQQEITRRLLENERLRRIEDERQAEFSRERAELERLRAERLAAAAELERLQRQREAELQRLAGVRDGSTNPQPHDDRRTTTQNNTHNTPAQGRVYFVQENDSLWSIAQREYGSGTHWQHIKQANPDRIRDNNTVNPGVRLILPPLPQQTSDNNTQRDHTTRGNDTRSTDTRGADTRTTDTRTAATERTITVQSRDVLSKLAAEHLGSASRWNELYEANRDVLSDPDALRPGMKLRLPATTTTNTTTNTTNTRANTNSTNTTANTNTRGSQRTYTVQSNDNLTRIAARELGDGNRWPEIYALNRDNMRSENDLRPGQRLRMP